MLGIRAHYCELTMIVFTGWFSFVEESDPRKHVNGLRFTNDNLSLS